MLGLHRHLHPMTCLMYALCYLIAASLHIKLCDPVHGASVGILCALVSQPADNMVSKLSNNPKATMGSVMAEMGIVKLFTAGLPLRILMVGTLTGLQWGIYDAFKVR